LRSDKAFEEEDRSRRKSNRHQTQDAAKAKLILEEQLYLFPERQRIARDVKDRCLKKKPWKR
jgi:signal transduction histidine kinase